MPVYYKYFLHERDKFNDRESMVYSALIYQSLNNSEFFTRDEGKLDMERVKAFIASNFFESGKETIEFNADKVNKSEIARETGIARSTVFEIYDKLVEKGIIDGDTIYCPIKLIDEHYFHLPKLPSGIKLTLQQRVFYGFLKDRSMAFGGSIDTKEYGLTTKFGFKKKEIIKTLIAVLKKNNLVERLPNKRLKIK